MFNKATSTGRQFDSFLERLSEMVAVFSRYSECIDTEKLSDLKENFIAKVDDFFGEERLLNIAVLGQVKAGKSSFLNALLFEGAEILPKGITPKTATLTRVEYAEQNELLVEYYTGEEWSRLEATARLGAGSQYARMAAEIVTSAMENGVSPMSYIAKGTESILFDSYDEVKLKLNTYVGENGLLTPLVKSVTIKINHPLLKGVTVVDTPGLNDPIVSRTEKTRQFIEKCDVSFFLSRSAHFLDKNDLELLTAQLPVKGINKLVLVASQYDNALMDTIYDAGSLEEADKKTKLAIRRHAIDVINRTTSELALKNYPDEVIKVIDGCRYPVFVSSSLYNLTQKGAENYNVSDELVVNALSVHSPVTEEEFLTLSGFTEINEIFEQIIKTSDELLAEKAKLFTVKAQNELVMVLNSLQQDTVKRLEVINDEGKTFFGEKIDMLTNSVADFTEKVNGLFDSFAMSLATATGDTYTSLQNIHVKYSALEEHKNVQVRPVFYTVSDAETLKPWTWWKKHSEFVTEELAYNYVDTEDIKHYMLLLIEYAEDITAQLLRSASDTEELRKELFEISAQFLSEEEDFDPSGLKALITEETARIKTPESSYIADTSAINRLLSAYPRQVMSEDSVAELQREYRKIMGNITDNLCIQLNQKSKVLRDSIEGVRTQVVRLLTASAQEKLSNLMRQSSMWNRRVNRHKEASELIQRYK